MIYAYLEEKVKERLTIKVSDIRSRVNANIATCDNDSIIENVIYHDNNLYMGERFNTNFLMKVLPVLYMISSGDDGTY